MNNADEVSKIDTSGYNSAYAAWNGAWNGYQMTKGQSSIDRVKGWADIVSSIVALCCA